MINSSYKYYRTTLEQCFKKERDVLRRIAGPCKAQGLDVETEILLTATEPLLFILKVTLHERKKRSNA